MKNWMKEFNLDLVKPGNFVLVEGEELSIETKIDSEGFFWVMDECGSEFDIFINDVDELREG